MTTIATRGLAPTREVLPNGAVVIVKDARTTPAVTINATVQAGSVFEPPDRAGLAYFLSRVLDRGTAQRSADEIAEELDSRGVSLNVTVTRHAMTLVCNCLAEDFDPILALIADLVCGATCPEEEVRGRRGEIVTAIRQDEDNPSVRAMDGVMELLYGGGHAYARRPKGTLESVERIGRDELRRFHAARVAPRALSLAIVGDVRTSAAIAAAGLAFGDWAHEAAPADPLPDAPPASGRRRRVLPMMNKAQADIAYGFTTITRLDPAYYAFWVMNNVLGQYGLGGRLGDSIREKQGMAYYVFSSFDANVVPGPLVVRAGVSPANVDRTIASIDAEVARLAADGITEQELADTKRYLIGSLPRMLETNAGIASFLQTAQQFDLGLDYDLRLPDLLKAVTRDEVHAAARSALDPGRAAIVVAGPYEEGKA